MTGEPVRFHTRCIPRELLAEPHPVSRVIIDNGLCDALSDDSLRGFRDLGIAVVETRAVWATLEPEEGVWDFSSLERGFEACDRFGIKLGLFAWPQHLPAWRLARCSLARLRCLEHGQDARTLSFWEPQAAEIVGSFYHTLARRFGDRPEMIYVGSAGCFGEPHYPQGVSHYHFFANTHNHVGYWCGDPLARRDFADKMIAQHGSLDAVSKAWGATLNSIDDIALPAQKSNPAMWVDFAKWYSESLMLFVDRVCEHAAIAFPRTPRVMPVGVRGEPIIVGQDKWRVAQIAAKHGMICRWTGAGDYNDFAKTNLEARRLSSACRLLGCGFATESASFISAENGMNCIYEQLSNGVCLVHDDPGNYYRNAACLRDNRALFQANQPRTRIAVFCSKLQSYFSDSGWDPVLFEQCVKLRSHCDFEILDEDMITTGGLGQIDLLISFGGLVRGEEPACTVRRWISHGGTLLERSDLSQARFGFQTLAEASGVAITSDFGSALKQVLARIDAVGGLSWGEIQTSNDRVYGTAFERELLFFNASDIASTVHIGERSIEIPSQIIRSFPVAKVSCV